MKSAIAVSNGAAQETMTSLELARVTGARHDNIKRTIERLAAGGSITLPFQKEVENDRNGPKKISVYDLNKRDSIVTVSRICPEFTERIIDMWKALDDERSAASRRAVTVPDFSDPAAMAEAWAAQYRASQAAEREVLQLTHKTQQDAPLVAFAEAVQATDDEIDVETMAKMLGLSRVKMMEFLREHRLVFKNQSGKNVPYQPHVDSGRLNVSETVWVDPYGVPHATQKTMVTGKGQVYIKTLFDLRNSASTQIPLPC